MKKNIDNKPYWKINHLIKKKQKKNKKNKQQQQQQQQMIQQIYKGSK